MHQPTRDECVHLLTRAVVQGESVVLLAPPGSGRSTVLDLLQRQLRGGVSLVRGRESVAGVPFVPFAQLLAAHGAPLDEPLRVYTELPVNLAEDRGALLVDDGDELDRASAVLVAQLHRAGVPCVLVLPHRDAAPEGLSRTCDRWPVIELPVLDLPGIARLAEELLGAPLIAPAAAELARLSGGLPALAAGLVRAAAAAGLVETSPAGARLRSFPVGERLLDYSGVEVADVKIAASALETVAVADRVPEAVLGAEQVALLVRLGLVSVTDSAVTIVVPLVGAWALGRMSRDQRRHRLREVAAAVRAGADPTWLEHARLLTSAGGDGEDRAAAALWLTTLGRLDEADLLLPPASGAPDWDHALARAEIDLALGRPEEAVGEVDGVEHLATTEDRLRALVRMWTAALGGRVPDHDGLKDRVERVLPRFTDRAEVALLAGAFERRRVIVGRGEQVAQTDDPVFLALRESMTGSLDRARDIAGASDAGRAGDDVDDEEQLKVLAHFLSLVYDGRLREGREFAERQHGAASDRGRPVLGLWTYNLSKIAFHAGQYDESARLALEGRRHLAWRDVAGQSLPMEAMYGAALARLGRLDQADAVIGALTPEERLLPRVAIGVARVEAERLRAVGQVPEAAGRLAAAGEYAVGNDEAHSGLLAVDESFMLHPDRGIADVLDSLRSKSALVAAFADRAGAVIARDPDGLLEVAGRFEEMIQPGRAAHAWTLAAELYASRRQAERARRCTQNAVRISSQWRVTPWPVAAAEEGVLTEREWQIAVRAAGRERSREIAEDLGLSVRTVDNHLTRTYRKLGVAGRDELAAALGLSG